MSNRKSPIVLACCPVRCNLHQKNSQRHEWFLSTGSIPGIKNSSWFPETCGAACGKLHIWSIGQATRIVSHPGWTSWVCSWSLTYRFGRFFTTFVPRIDPKLWNFSMLPIVKQNTLYLYTVYLPSPTLFHYDHIYDSYQRGWRYCLMSLILQTYYRMRFHGLYYFSVFLGQI